MKETELQVQKIINLQNVTNNLPDAFTDYKGVTKSWNPMVNSPERVEVPKKTTHAPSIVKMGRVAQTKKDKAPNKRPRKEKTRSLQKIVNVSQPRVDRHLVDIPQSSTEMHYRNENASTLETLMPSYWEIMRHQQGYKKFPLTILVSEKCMTIVLQLSTHVSQPSLLRIS
jgi:hypothetical protein